MSFTPAKRGDLAAVVTTTSDYVIGRPATERTSVRLGVVTSVSREGRVKMVRYPDRDAPTPVGPQERVLVVSKAQVDVDAAMAAARAHTWPQHDSPMPFGSIDEARDAIRPALR